MKIPQEHQTVMPYLILKGGQAFMDFARQVFNATEIQKYMADERSVMHAEIRIGDSTIMLGDSSEQWKPAPASLYIYVENVDATYEKALSQGATSLMEPQDKDYGRASGVQDPFGNIWWITAAPV